jgi:hypothetical protein
MAINQSNSSEEAIFVYPLAELGRIIATPEDHAKRPLHNWESDNAVDISAKVGTPVYAVLAGVIGKQLGPLNSNNPLLLGQRLHLITTDDEFYYAHLSQIAEGITPGLRVEQGQMLGQSGVANGVAHLHLGVRKANPLDVLENSRLNIPVQEPLPNQSMPSNDQTPEEIVSFPQSESNVPDMSTEQPEAEASFAETESEPIISGEQSEADASFTETEPIMSDPNADSFTPTDESQATLQSTPSASQSLSGSGPSPIDPKNSESG